MFDNATHILVGTSGRSPLYDMYMIQCKYEKQLLRKN
jgi:hypothetical protein